uniref:AP2/ERF domain-containing protein n=1 Tax=uncultured SAR11 cluster alpha proteobacterium H17925_45G17 TaxID=715038 RepID=E7CA33_9PROT|nr:hypothetical protein [uncultured SAR11 cluster alpha proteobacterium H17925_45G17]
MELSTLRNKRSTGWKGIYTTPRNKFAAKLPSGHKTFENEVDAVAAMYEAAVAEGTIQDPVTRSVAEISAAMDEQYPKPDAMIEGHRYDELNKLAVVQEKVVSDPPQEFEPKVTAAPSKPQFDISEFKSSKTISGFTGVKPERGRWRADATMVSGAKKYIGYFTTPEEAAAYLWCHRYCCKVSHIGLHDVPL